MKAHCLLICAALSLVFSQAAAQSTDKRLELFSADSLKGSRAANLLSSEGVLLKKEFFPLGFVGRAEFEVIVLTDMKDGARTGALRVKVPSTTSYGADNGYIGTIDSDELGDYIEAAKVIKSQMSLPIPECYTEYQFSTRDKVQIGGFSGKTWNTFIKVAKYNTTQATEYFKSVDALDQVISILEKARTGLKVALSE